MKRRITQESDAEFYSVEFDETDECPVCGAHNMYTWTRHEPADDGHMYLLIECAEDSCGAAFVWHLDHP